jgi:DNA-binding IclR family transcriptional regulator
MTQLALRRALGERRVIDSAGFPNEGVVKSAARVLMVLELFDVLCREAPVSEIAELLGFPQSSTSVLLRSMTAIGYLKYNKSTRAYVPTAKVTLLGLWLNGSALKDGAVLQMMERINRQTKLCTVLAARNRTQAQYIHVMQTRGVERAFVIKGVLRSLIASSVGYCFLSEDEDAEIKRLAVRINSEMTDAEQRVGIAGLMDEIVKVRSNGYAMTAGLVTSDGGMISMPLPVRVGGERLVIGVGGLSTCIIEMKEEIVSILREEIADLSRSDDYQYD